MKHVGNIKKRVASFFISPHSVGYSLKACLFASPSNHPICKIIEEIFFGTVRKTPNYDDADELFFWYV